MAFTTKPTTIPEWATSDVVDGVTGQNNVIEPPAGKKLIGWIWKEKPARNWWNWMQRFNYLWINYFNQFHNGDSVTVGNQTDFNAIIERVLPNQYKLLDSILSLEVYPLAGGYQMSGVLSGGDTYGKITTNNCVTIEFKGGAFIDVGNERSYIEVDTDDCHLKNVNIKGTGTVASAVARSFLLNANRVTYDNCKCSNRLSNTTQTGFEGSGTLLENLSSKHANCTVFDLTSSGLISAYKDCRNLDLCIGYNIESTGNTAVAFSSCSGGSTNIAYNIVSSAAAHGFSSCSEFSSSGAIEITSGSGFAVGFESPDQLAACISDTISSTGSAAIGYRSFKQVTSSLAINIDTTSGSGNAQGFGTGFNAVGCLAETIDADSGDATGFYNVDQIAGCETDSIGSVSGTASGFASCNYGAALKTDAGEDENRNCDYIDTVDVQITNKTSTASIWD